ncbi:MAG: hypothetical protein AB1Z98_28455 [Nannocystaceae bacterium]
MLSSAREHAQVLFDLYLAQCRLGLEPEGERAGVAPRGSNDGAHEQRDAGGLSEVGGSTRHRDGDERNDESHDSAEHGALQQHHASATVQELELEPNHIRQLKHRALTKLRRAIAQGASHD